MKCSAEVLLWQVDDGQVAADIGGGSVWPDFSRAARSGNTGSGALGADHMGIRL